MGGSRLDLSVPMDWVRILNTTRCLLEKENAYADATASGLATEVLGDIVMEEPESRPTVPKLP
jgi:hypothetical protein